MHSESSLARLHKKAVPQKGPCPSTKRASSSTCSLVDTESSRSCRSNQRTRLVMYHRDLREITRVKAPYQWRENTQTNGTEMHRIFELISVYMRVVCAPKALNLKFTWSCLEQQHTQVLWSTKNTLSHSKPESRRDFQQGPWHHLEHTISRQLLGYRRRNIVRCSNDGVSTVRVIRHDQSNFDGTTDPSNPPIVSLTA